MSTLAPQIDEDALIRERIAQIAPPEGVKLKRLEQATDSAGDPSLRIYFAVSKRIPATRRRMAELIRFQDAVWDEVWHLKLGRWPFIYFQEAR